MLHVFGGAETNLLRVWERNWCRMIGGSRKAEKCSGYKACGWITFSVIMSVVNKRLNRHYKYITVVIIVIFEVFF